VGLEQVADEVDAAAEGLQDRLVVGEPDVQTFGQECGDRGAPGVQLPRRVMEQDEVAPGVWLPTRIAYDFDGRKFLFGFELLEVTTVSSYRRIGPPREALADVRHELNTSGAARPAQ